ncbi:MAG: hypothetical protein IJ278_05050 [Clostridia bacterium]|nr:hypothetical protein [Clostridia bacterium]
MKNKKKIAIVLIAIVLIILFVNTAHIHHEKQWLQKNIDHIFTWHFSQLNFNQMVIALNPDMSEEERSYYEGEVTKAGYIISQLFASTSYRESIGLNVIVGLLDPAPGTDAINELHMTKELNDLLNELHTQHFSDEQKISETLEILKKSIIEK